MAVLKGRGKEDKKDDKLKRDVDLIVKRLHERRFKVLRRYDVSFVGREGEARYILERVAAVVPSNNLYVLYGPKGCGKSTFFKHLMATMHETRGTSVPFDAVILSYREKDVGGVEGAEEEVEKYLDIGFSRGLERFVKSALRDILRSGISPLLEGGLGGIVSNIGMINIAERLILSFITNIKHVKKNGKVLIVLDEVRLNRDNVDGFRNWLETFANKVRNANENYMRIGG